MAGVTYFFVGPDQKTVPAGAVDRRHDSFGPKSGFPPLAIILIPAHSLGAAIKILAHRSKKNRGPHLMPIFSLSGPTRCRREYSISKAFFPLAAGIQYTILGWSKIGVPSVGHRLDPGALSGRRDQDNGPPVPKTRFHSLTPDCELAAHCFFLTVLVSGVSTATVLPCRVSVE